MFIIGHQKTTTKDNPDVLKFILDSGATDHFVMREDVLNDVVDLQPPIAVSIAKNEVTVNATKKGNIYVITD